MEPTGCWISYVPTNVVLADLAGLRNLMINFQHYFDPCIVCFDRTCDACGDSSGEGDDKGNYQHGIR